MYKHLYKAMDELVLIETIIPERLNKLIQSPALEDKEVKALKAYRKLMGRTTGAVPVKYTKRMGMGRRYAEKSLSLQMFCWKIRQTLVHDTHTDIDIKNCHPVILSQYCQKNNILCPNLDDYIKNRNAKLTSIMEECNVGKDIAKNMIISIMYLGKLPDFCPANGITGEHPPPKWVDELAIEFANTADIIRGIEADIYKQICSSKSKSEEYKNKTATTLSYVLCIIEDNLIMNARDKLTKMGCEIQTLCFDGLLIKKTEVTAEMLGEVSAYCEEHTSYNVDFEVKPMNNVIDLESAEDTNTDFDNYEHPEDKLTTYDQHYCHSLKRPKPSEEYALKKNYIEHFLCKVCQPVPQYVLQNGKDRHCQFWSPAECSLMFLPITSGIVNQMGNPISFYEQWTKDVFHRHYTYYDFIPYNVESNCPANTLNVFEGFNPEIYGEPMEDITINKYIKPYTDLVRELCGGSEDDATYFHHFVAHMFQYPANKPPVAIIFKGKQGTGKNMILDAIGNMLNNTHYITSSKAEDFYGTHAEGYYRKILVNLNEAEGKKTFDFEGQMKSMITEDVMTINPKNVRPSEVKNCARTIITTNKATPVAIDVRSKDRRYVVYQTTERYLKYQARFWTDLKKHLRSPNFMRALYQWLMKFNVTDYNWIKNRPLTEAYKEMCNLYSPVEALFFEDLYLSKGWHSADDEDSPKTTGDDMIKIPIAELYSKYEVFAKKHRFMKDSAGMASSRSFVSKIIELDFPLIRTRTMTDKTLSFVPKEMLEHAIARQWLMGYEAEVKEITDDDKVPYDGSYFDMS